MLARLLRTLRPLHWTKNLLLFAPVVLAHRFERASLGDVALAFLAFCLAASGTYLFNDLRDLEFDRLHPRKRERVIASGAISPRTAAATATILVVSGLGIAYLADAHVLVYLLIYGALSLGYSLLLKRIVFLDVLTLSALYTVRVLAGGAAGLVEVSDWLLALCVFLFVSLALLKRYADLGLILKGEGHVVPGRGYLTSDRDLLRSMGVASGYLSVLVLALYLNSPQVTRFYRSPRLLWLVSPFLLYWIAHMWFLAHRGKIEDDPIVVAAKDPVSYVIGALIAIIAIAAV